MRLDMTPDARRALNRLAREQVKLKLYRDILFDLNICKLEGWDCFEYIDELIEMLKGLRRRDNAKDSNGPERE